MNNSISLKEALVEAKLLSKAGDPLSVLKLLVGYKPQPVVVRKCAMCMSYIKTSYTVEFFTDCTQHDSVDGFNHEEDEHCEDCSEYWDVCSCRQNMRDWDLEAKDEEVMAE